MRRLQLDEIKTLLKLGERLADEPNPDLQAELWADGAEYVRELTSEGVDPYEIAFVTEAPSHDLFEVLLHLERYEPLSELAALLEKRTNAWIAFRQALKHRDEMYERLGNIADGEYWAWSDLTEDLRKMGIGRYT